MPCEGCPEQVPLNNPKGVAVIVYTGGPLYAPFTCVAQALADDNPEFITKWSKPSIHKRGAIEYQQNETEPPEIEGYQRDASNPQLLCPIWPHCVWRSLCVWRADDGSVKIAGRCLIRASETNGQTDLTLAQCEKCPQRTAQ